MPKYYCRFNAFCVHPGCNQKHFYSKYDRLKIYKIIEKNPDIYIYNEEKTTKLPCKYSIRCININCDLYHGLNYETRIILNENI